MRGSRCWSSQDDAKREYAYGPAQGLLDTRVGTFTQALYDEAKKDGWIVISMKNDWKAYFRLRELTRFLMCTALLMNSPRFEKCDIVFNGAAAMPIRR